MGTYSLAGCPLLTFFLGPHLGGGGGTSTTLGEGEAPPPPQGMSVSLPHYKKAKDHW